MSYTLKSTGLATNLIGCVAVDEDGTITEFKGHSIALGTGVAATVADGAWKGTSRKYFETLANGDFGFFGITYTGTPPNAGETSANGLTIWMALHGAHARSADCPMFGIGIAAGGTRGLKDNGSGKAVYHSGGTVAASTTTIPTNGTTKFSVGASYKDDTSSEVFYGLESGSAASEDTEAGDGGFGGAGNLLQEIGGASGAGNHRVKPYIACVFNKRLSEAEIQSLHGNGTDTWITTLFESGAGAPASTWNRSGARIIRGRPKLSAF